MYEMESAGAGDQIEKDEIKGGRSGRERGKGIHVE